MAVSQVCKEGEHKKPSISWVTSSARCQSSSCSLLSAKAALGAFGGQELQALEEEELQPCPRAAQLTVAVGFRAGMTGGSWAPLVHPATSNSLIQLTAPTCSRQVRPETPAQVVCDKAGALPRSPESSQSCQLLEGEQPGQDFPTTLTSHGIAAPKGTKHPSQTSVPGGIVDRQNPELLSPVFLSLLHGSRPEFSKTQGTFLEPAPGLQQA